MLTDPAARHGVERAVGGRPWRRFSLSAAIFGLIWVTAAVLLTTRWLDASQKQLLSDVLLVVCPLPGLLYAARAARTSRGRPRKAWWSFAGTLASWEAGNLIWFYYQFIADHQPHPTVGDAFYVLALICAAVGLALFPTGRARGDGRARLALDALSIGCAVLLASDVLVLHEVFGAMGTGLGAVVFVTYPIGDVILASMAILLLTRSPGRTRADLVLVAVGLLIYAVGDAGYALLGARGQFQMGTPVDLAWLAGYLLVGHAALTPTATREEHRGLRHAGTNVTGALFVHVTMMGAAIVAFHDGAGDPVEYVLGATLVALFLLRQVVLIRDNRELHKTLERRVAMRTAQLERLAHRHQGILDAVGEGIYEVDADRRVTFVNPAAARLLGYERDELLGRDAHGVFHHEEEAADGETGDACPGCHITAAMEGADVVRRSDACYVRRGGDRFPVDLTAAPRQDEEGAVSGAVVMFSDISERRAVERMKEEFISVVSHELRTPLTAIRGSLGLIAGGAVGEVPAEARRMVDLALNNSERLSRLINDLLDLERMQSGAIPIEFGIHDTEDLVETTLRSVRAVADAAGVHVVRGLVRGTVHGDADRIVQALTNLIGNAVKFSPPGGRVEVSAEPEGAHITFTVSDQGRGIPQDKIETVFERFQQVDSSDAREKGGTGLGLAITKSIVERHGGRIGVESRPGHGSTFAFTIPAALEPAVFPNRTDGSATDVPTVLICDDDPYILETIGSLLSRHGYATRPVARGRDAIDQAIEGHPDVILLDLRMPGMTGWEAISELKARPETRDIPIVIMSGLGPDADPELAEKTDGWLTKPIEEPRIAEVLMSAIRGDDNPPTVLVVEDDPDLASVLVMMFEREGFATLRAATQHEATTLVRQQPPDVLVLDIYLLDGDGYGVIDALRAGGRGGTVPVIVYSAHQLDAASRQRLRLGEMTFMTKGRDAPQDLVRRVVDVVHSMARDKSDDATTERRETRGLATDTPGRR